MLYFNQSGLLVPGAVISSSVNELETEFVTNIPTPERIIHFSAYIKYSDALNKVCENRAFVQRIDGSFVTKEQSPTDIDVVTFIDFHLIAKLGNMLQSFKYPESETNFAVDAYIVAVYPIEHSQHYLYQHDKAYWIDQFDTTRRNRKGNRYSKGFLEIIY